MWKFRHTSVRNRNVTARDGMTPAFRPSSSQGLRRWAAVAVVCLAASIPWQPAVSVALPGQRPLTVFPLRHGEQFAIRFIHSIDELPIIERYALDASGLVQTETRLISFGVGTGYVEGAGVLTADGEWIVIEDMNRHIGSLRQRVGVESVDHTVLWRGRALPLSQMFPGTLFVIEGTRMSLFDSIRTAAALLLDEAFGARKGRLWQTL